jgi:hypothetical protein
MSAGFAELVMPFVGGGLEARVTQMAVIGGTASVLGGGKFANGAATSSFGYLFNYLGHCKSTTECMKREGYQPTQYPNGAVCNSSVAGCTPGVGTDTETGQAATALFLAVATGGTTVIDAIGAYGLRQLTVSQLNAIIADSGGTMALRELFGSGLPGAQASLANSSLVAPAALTTNAAAAYRVLAERAIANYTTVQNTAGLALQRARVELLKKVGF